VIAWRNTGMLLIGKMNPDSISVGRNDVRSAI
jgi:hypothetical protein